MSEWVVVRLVVRLVRAVEDLVNLFSVVAGINRGGAPIITWQSKLKIVSCLSLRKNIYPELTVVDLTITILINSLDHFINLFVRHLPWQMCQHKLQFLRCYTTWILRLTSISSNVVKVTLIIFTKHSKRLLQFIFNVRIRDFLLHQIAELWKLNKTRSININLRKLIHEILIFDINLSLHYWSYLELLILLDSDLLSSWQHAAPEYKIFKRFWKVISNILEFLKSSFHLGWYCTIRIFIKGIKGLFEGCQFIFFQSFYHFC